MSPWIGIVFSFLYVFMVIGISTLLMKRGFIQGEASRKTVHILVSNWWLIAMWAFTSPVWAAAVPAAFVLINYASYRFGIFSAMERGGGKEDLGTVWYAVSLLILALTTFSAPLHPWVGAVGILAMGYGDGFAAIVGKRFGRMRFPMSKKSLEGSTVLFVSVFTTTALVTGFSGIASFLALSFVVASAATVVELATPMGLDNLTLPLSSAGLAFLLSTHTELLPYALGFAASSLLILPAFARGSLDRPGAVAAILLGTLVQWTGGWVAFLALILFFGPAVLVSRTGSALKEGDAKAVHRRTGSRTAVQVLANGGPALLFLIISTMESGSTAFLGAGLCALAAAGADTWSSELGMLSRHAPVSLLTRQPVRRGISGGVTSLGFLGALVGAAFVAPLALFIGLPVITGLLAVAVVAVCGMAGSLLDSLLGDTLQAKYRDTMSEGWTERTEMDGAALPLERGFAWVDNDLVNAASSLAAGGIGLGLFLLLI
jgi:uncharacterized protein (TIGR00297 family)